jgi:hypothetical protein
MALSKSARYWEELRQRLNVEVYWKDRSFMRPISRKSKRKEPVSCFPVIVSAKRRRKLPKKFKGCFRRERGPFGKARYVLKYEGIFREKIVVRYITHGLLPDPDLQSRIARLENFIRNHHTDHKIEHVLGNRAQPKNWKIWGSKGQEKKKQMVLRSVMNEHYFMKDQVAAAYAAAISS